MQNNKQVHNGVFIFKKTTKKSLDIYSFSVGSVLYCMEV